VERVRYEKSGHGFAVGEVVRTKAGVLPGPRAYGRVVGFMPYEGSGLVFEDGIVVCETIEARPTRFEFGWGAMERA
jgi:hypothetical protein